MKNKLRLLIREVLGHYVPLDNLTNNVATHVINKLAKKSDNGKTKLNPFDDDWTINTKELDVDTDQENTEIGSIYVSIIPINDNARYSTNKVSGTFSVDANNKSFVNINLKIVNWDYKTNLGNEIKKVLSHEIYHAFRRIKNLTNPDYKDVLNKTRNKMSLYNTEFNNDLLEEFLEIFYLGLKEEVLARIHEAYTQMENLKLKFGEKNHNEVIRKLNTLSVFKDFLRVQNFNVDALVSLPDKIKKEYVNKFNEILKESKSKIKIIENPDDFFRYWVHLSKKRSLQARHKIISQALNIFGNKQISEYGNKKFSYGYPEQFLKEIVCNLDEDNLMLVYDFSDENYSLDDKKDFLNSIKCWKLKE